MSRVFQTMVPGQLFSNNSSLATLFKQFTPGNSFQTICPRQLFSNNVPTNPLQTICPGQLASNNVLGSRFQTICHGHPSSNNLSPAALFKQCPGQPFSNNSPRADLSKQFAGQHGGLREAVFPCELPPHRHPNVGPPALLRGEGVLSTVEEGEPGSKEILHQWEEAPYL